MSAKVWRTSSAVAYIVQRRGGGGGGGGEVYGKEERRPAGLPSGAGAIKGIDFRKRKGGKLWRENAALVLHYALMAGF
jgi:hypothetical protein